MKRILTLALVVGASLAHADVIDGRIPECPPNRVAEYDHGFSGCRRPMCNDQSDCFAGQHCPVHRCARQVEDTECLARLARGEDPWAPQPESPPGATMEEASAMSTGETESSMSSASSMAPTMEGMAQKPGGLVLAVAEPPPPCPPILEHIDQECDRCNECPEGYRCWPVRCVDGPLPASITPCPADYTPRAPNTNEGSGGSGSSSTSGSSGSGSSATGADDCSAGGTGAGALPLALVLLVLARRPGRPRARARARARARQRGAGATWRGQGQGQGLRGRLRRLAQARRS